MRKLWGKSEEKREGMGREGDEKKRDGMGREGEEKTEGMGRNKSHLKGEEIVKNDGEEKRGG